MSAPLSILDADAYVEGWAQVWDSMFPGTGDLLRDYWHTLLAEADWCDCPLDPHRWNCARTPIWAQTICDLDTNPWPATRSAIWGRPEIRVNRFTWDGSRGTYCGRGPCCLGDNHDGRCRM